jgi:hypothetical protein
VAGLVGVSVISTLQDLSVSTCGCGRLWHVRLLFLLARAYDAVGDSPGVRSICPYIHLACLTRLTHVPCMYTVYYPAPKVDRSAALSSPLAHHVTSQLHNGWLPCVSLHRNTEPLFSSLVLFCCRCQVARACARLREQAGGDAQWAVDAALLEARCGCGEYNTNSN